MPRTVATQHSDLHNKDSALILGKMLKQVAARGGKRPWGCVKVDRRVEGEPTET